MLIRDNRLEGGANLKNEQQNFVAFYHSFRTPCANINMQPNETFATVYQDALVNWEIQIEKNSNIRSFLLHNLSAEPKYQVVLSHAGMREKYPPAQKVEFTIRILDSNGNPVSKALKHRVSEQDNEDVLFRVDFRTPESSAISRLLVVAAVNPEYANHLIEVATCIEFKLIDMIGINHITINNAPPVPIELDYRFNSLVDPKRHNFILKTRFGAQYNCNKEALFVASRWFRELLTPSMTEMRLEVDSLEAIDTAVTFLLSEHYKSPEKMTPKLAGEIIFLNKCFISRRSKLLKDSVERQCYEELVKNHEDLEYVIEMVILSREFMLFNLQGACVACIVSMHYNDFVETYANRTADNDALHESITFQASVVSIVKKTFTQANRVRSFLRKIPASG